VDYLSGIDIAKVTPPHRWGADARISAYIMRPDGHVHYRINLVCKDEADAKKHAKALVADCDVELWQLDRLIERFESKGQGRLTQSAGDQNQCSMHITAMSSNDEYRKQAADAEKQASLAHGEVDRAAWLRIAQGFLGLLRKRPQSDDAESK
jgi:hypothetical protein